MQGWFKLHRELFETDLWHDVSTFRLFLYLISQASHKDGVKTKGIELNRGQYIRSYRKLADDLSYKEGRGYKKYSLSTIKSCVNKLIESERVNVQETEVGTLFTILNYAKYQDLDGEGQETPNTKSEEVRTNAELTPNEVRTNSEQEQELKNLRIKELKDTTTTAAENPIQLFEKLLCRLSTNQSHSLFQWVDDFEGKTEIVNEAITIADNKNKRYFGFVEFLLKEWANNNLTTLDRVKAYEQEKFNSQKVKPYPRKGVIRTEKLPDWFDEDYAQQEKPKQTVDDISRKKAELVETLKKLKAGS
ncbi:DnaD domain-containing protein [Bacillus sp. S/N-304-OC-R1]|uniref:DnaD domain-containing protein n=1 Tax=Bacillus sp. S/N-304-OC-R1 TaxID=2758034 RepID=UPI001C8EC555|nr:DnaD domain protein [Bacillus sp. S/N-304-OC-R1]MBY0122186.1 DnaD domain protein [Bacillus sp. S/N-304-OC-R1]